MAIQITNQTASPALTGEAVEITLNQSETENKLPLLTVGQQVGIVSSGFLGTICRVDYDGTSFLASPNSPIGNLSSTSTPGVLNATELINID